MDTCRIVIVILCLAHGLSAQQFVRPDATIAVMDFSNNGCGGAVYHECVDDVVPDENTTYLGTNRQDAYVYLGFEDASEPASPDDQVLRYRMTCSGSATVSVFLQDLTVGVVASTSHTVTAGYSDYELAIPVALNDYTALRTQIYVSSISGALRVTQIEFQVELAGESSKTVNGLVVDKINGVVPLQINGK